MIFPSNKDIWLYSISGSRIQKGVIRPSYFMIQLSTENVKGDFLSQTLAQWVHKPGTL